MSAVSAVSATSGVRRVHRMPFGAELLPGGGARFALWAPAARHVELVLHAPSGGSRAHAGRLQPGGWHLLQLADVGPGQRYQWRVEGGLQVPDPASRHNPQGPHGPSVLVDPADFVWSDEGWCGRPWSEVVLYELHIGCFTAEGSFAAAIDELPRLAALGITALQLMPLADFPGEFGWGYDGVLPFAPYHGYGTPDELKRFVLAAHRLGLMVFGDVVYNHFGPDGNYLHAYAPPFFSSRHRTAWGPALNFDGDGAAVVREFVIHNALYWIEEFHFDGLRLDAVHAMLDDSRPHILHELSRRVRAAAAGRHVHLVLENDHNDETLLGAPGTSGRFDGQWNGDLHHTLHVLLTGEHEGYYAEYDRPVEQLARCLSHGFARQGGVHGIARDTAATTAAPRRDAQGQAPLLAMVNFLHNHDQIGNRAFGERLQQLAAAPAMRLATALWLLSPTTPMLFMGEESGSAVPFLYFADWQGDLRDAVQRGRIAEFAHFQRYAQAAREGRLPDPCSRETFLRSKLGAAAQTDPAWAAFYAGLLAKRRQALQPWLAALAAHGHRSQVAGSLLQVAWDFGARRLQVQANLGPAEAEAQAPPPQAEELFVLGANTPTTLAAWGGRWHWLVQPA